MSFFKYKLNVVVLLGLIIAIYSCTNPDEYLKFTKDGAISYTGKIDSLKFFSGKNRVKIQGLFISDPKVSELRVYWNNKKDSTVFSINRTSGVDQFSSFIENLPENIYNFEVRTFDAKGNGSIIQNKTVEVYGDRYYNSLINRPVVSSIIEDNVLTIKYATMDLSSGVLGTEVIYTTQTNETKTVFVPIKDNSLVLTDFKVGTTYQYHTVYKPNSTAIDQFYTVNLVVKPLQWLPITVVNGDFQSDGNSKIANGWGPITGWSSDRETNDSGVQPVDGSMRGYIQAIAVAPAAWQLSNHVIVAGEQYKVTLGYISDAWQGGNLKVSLYYFANGVRNILKTKTFAGTGNGSYVVTSDLIAEDSPAIGSKIGIEVLNPWNVDWASFTNFDNVELFYR